MMMKTKSSLICIILLLACLVPAGTLLAQATGGNKTGTGTGTGGAGNAGATGEEDGIKGFWEVELQGGRFMARLDTISSVSQHQYIVDGAARVYEVTIDTNGSQTARFYYIEPVGENSPLSIGKNAIDRLKSVAEGATSRTGMDEVWTQVIKNYPATTHARTAEYRIQSKGILDTIYGHVRKVWAQERGRGKSNKLRINPKKE